MHMLHGGYCYRSTDEISESPAAGPLPPASGRCPPTNTGDGCLLGRRPPTANAQTVTVIEAQNLLQLPTARRKLHKSTIFKMATHTGKPPTPPTVSSHTTVPHNLFLGRKPTQPSPPILPPVPLHKSSTQLYHNIELLKQHAI